MAKCWARVRGGCGHSSREHVVSAGVLRGELITIAGMSWCATPRTIPTEEAVARVLCEHHNVELSPVDTMGIAAMAAIDRASDLTRERRRRVEMDWGTEVISIDGGGLERWVLKTALNLAALGEVGGTKWHSREPLDQPPELLVRAAFGEAQLIQPMGLYALLPLHGKELGWRQITAIGLTHPDGGYTGHIFVLQNIRLMLWLSGDPPGDVEMLDPISGKLEKCEVLYRPWRLEWRVDDWKYSHCLEFSWPEDVMMRTVPTPPSAAPLARGAPG